MAAAIALRLLALLWCAAITRSCELEREVSADLSQAVQLVLCAVELGKWSLPKNSTALRAVGCLLGGKNRCGAVRSVPLEAEVGKSAAPPAAKNKQYQALAMKAEELVPKTWWREGFDNSLLLLSKDDGDLPRKQFDIGRLSNKKLKNMHQCVTRQQFIRRSFVGGEEAAAEEGGAAAAGGCSAMSQTVVKHFFEMWTAQSAWELFGGEIVTKSASSEWAPAASGDGLLLVSALEVLQHFYANYGGVWTGCFKLEKSSACRGALAAAAMVSSMHILYDSAAKRRDVSESTFVSGYLLASLARGLLHGDGSATGNKPVTKWKMRLADCVGLQQAFLRLYVDSYGALYASQLDAHLPMAFAPSFEVHAKKEWRHLTATQFEPVYTSLRNWMFHESSNLIDFGPYRPLVALALQDQSRWAKLKHQRRVLIDVGANGFFASPKYLLDSYAPYLPFTHAIMIEPEPHFSATVPPCYSERYNITFLQIYAEVNTGSPTDIIKLLPSLVTKDDFVVLKFDVDPNRYAQGPTMEWGFLFDLMQNEATATLVDETYIELHFSFPKLYWYHYHSNWEALDALRYLRSKGAVVHAWP